MNEQFGEGYLKCLSDIITYIDNTIDEEQQHVDLWHNKTEYLQHIRTLEDVKAHLLWRIYTRTISSDLS